MSETTVLLTTIDDYLLSLADGIALAQSELSRAAAAGPPGQQFTYYLPRLDFELRMKMRVTKSEQLSQRYESVRAPEARDTHLLFTPVTGSSTSTTEVTSVIKGAFVAVPPNQGLPATQLTSTVHTTADGFVITIEATTTANEPRASLAVEVNLDREESEDLTGAALDWTGTDLDAGLLLTDALGTASVTLTVGAAMAPGAQLLISLDADGRTELLVVQVPA